MISPTIVLLVMLYRVTFHSLTGNYKSYTKPMSTRNLYNIKRKSYIDLDVLERDYRFVFYLDGKSENCLLLNGVIITEVINEVFKTGY